MHQRFFDLSLTALKALLANPPAGDFTIQFSDPSNDDVDSLSVVNRICEQVGQSATVRFFDHRRSQLDCETLVRLPACRSLLLDVDIPLVNIESIAAMQSLEALGLHVTDASAGDVLNDPNVRSVGKLTIGGDHNAACNLALLRNFPEPAHAQGFFHELSAD